jgi:hypothetical protein
MELSKLLLTKGEIQLFHKVCFQIPIHPKLLELDIHIRKGIINEVFPKVAREWYQELKEYLETSHNEDKETISWIKEAFLKEKPKIVKEGNYQRINHLSWRDEVMYEENGLARGFSISRNSG